MKLRFDQNLSPKLVGLLAADFPGSAHVLSFGLDHSSDSAVWSFAAVNGYAIATKDVDFLQRALLHGHPPKVVLLQVGNCTTGLIAGLLKARRDDILKLDGDPLASFIALS